MRVVVSYDISKDRPRTRVAKVFEGVLDRVQYSVFEGDIPEDELRRAVEKLLTQLEPATDSLRVYRICGACAGRVDCFGRPVVPPAGTVKVL
jgi:CRISPR-associated protein Cas2